MTIADARYLLNEIKRSKVKQVSWENDFIRSVTVKVNILEPLNDREDKKLQELYRISQGGGNHQDREKIG